MSRVGAPGSVAIPSVGAGDIVLSFDPNNPAERIRASRIVKSMIRGGYALLVEVERDGEKKFVRATDFDENACRYVIADHDPSAAEPEEPQGDAIAQVGQAQDQVPEQPAASRPAAKRRGVVKKHVPAESTRAVSVARTAGG